mmetsp:Transcript_13388/g.34235  ORF Transcript_13388/g.34235 Transcript_13388/m.34235 type:complete len:222 (+) Transcript_13388:1022-1687(+)
MYSVTRVRTSGGRTPSNSISSMNSRSKRRACSLKMAWSRTVEPSSLSSSSPSSSAAAAAIVSTPVAGPTLSASAAHCCRRTIDPACALASSSLDSSSPLSSEAMCTAKALRRRDSDHSAMAGGGVGMCNLSRASVSMLPSTASTPSLTARSTASTLPRVTATCSSLSAASFKSVCASASALSSGVAPAVKVATVSVRVATFFSSLTRRASTARSTTSRAAL